MYTHMQTKCIHRQENRDTYICTYIHMNMYVFTYIHVYTEFFF